MNCQECRKHLNPYLDNELDVSQNLAILEHRNACEACEGIFSREERSWEVLRNRLRGEQVPERLRAAVYHGLGGEDRRRARRRVLGTGVAAASLLLVALFAVGVSDLRGLLGLGPHDHGGGVAFATGHFLHLAHLADERQLPILSEELLSSLEFEPLEGPQICALMGELFGSPGAVPREVREACHRAARPRRELEYDGHKVRNLIFDLGDAELGMYHMPRHVARTAGLHTLKEGEARPVRIESCRSCQVVAVTRGDTVFVLVARPRHLPKLLGLAKRL